MGSKTDNLRASFASADASFSNRSMGAASIDCPVNRHWIQIELVGEDGKGISDASYEVTAPGGELRKGLTDAQGKARIEGISAGICKVSFPALDKSAWDLFSAKK